MNNPQAKPSVAKDENVDQDVRTLEDKFGGWAQTYAETRSEAAQLRGAEGDAGHWRQVEDEIESDLRSSSARDTDMRD